MLTLLLTRHGHTVRSTPETYLGQRIAAPLSDRGRADAEGLAARLAGVPIDRVVSSPLERAAETARIVAGHRVAIETDARLMEMDYGSWEGRTADDVERVLAADYARYDEDPSTLHVGGAESGTDLAVRVRGFIGDLLDWWQAEEGDRTVLVVGHSSLNRVVMAVLLETPLRDYRRRFQFDWLSLTVLRWSARDAGPLLLLANDMAHLRGTTGATWD